MCIRDSTYDAIIMDPPSYGRGPGGEVWKLEEQLGRLLERTAQLLSDRAVFFLVNSYTGGLSPTIVRYMVELEVGKGRKGAVLADEIGLPVTDRGMVLPCGNTPLWLAHRALPFMDKSLSGRMREQDVYQRQGQISRPRPAIGLPSPKRPAEGKSRCVEETGD